jgi:hypothetical protein
MADVRGNGADRIEHYRQRAAEMLRFEMEQADARAGFRGLARCWLRLADEIERRKEDA